MASEGDVGSDHGISKRPSQQQSPVAAVEKPAQEHDEKAKEAAAAAAEEKPWVVRKWIASFAVCLAALPFLLILVSRRRDEPLPLASGWTSATTYTHQGIGTDRYTPHLVWSCSILNLPCLRTRFFFCRKNWHWTMKDNRVSMTFIALLVMAMVSFLSYICVVYCAQCLNYTAPFSFLFLEMKILGKNGSRN